MHGQCISEGLENGGIDAQTAKEVEVLLQASASKENVELIEGTIRKLSDYIAKVDEKHAANFTALARLMESAQDDAKSARAKADEIKPDYHNVDKALAVLDAKVSDMRYWGRALLFAFSIPASLAIIAIVFREYWF